MAARKRSKRAKVKKAAMPKGGAKQQGTGYSGTRSKPFGGKKAAPFKSGGGRVPASKGVVTTSATRANSGKGAQ
jgi:hypothetical protein